MPPSPPTSNRSRRERPERRALRCRGRGSEPPENIDSFAVSKRSRRFRELTHSDTSPPRLPSMSNVVWTQGPGARRPVLRRRPLEPLRDVDEARNLDRQSRAERRARHTGAEQRRDQQLLSGPPHRERLRLLHRAPHHSLTMTRNAQLMAFRHHSGSRATASPRRPAAVPSSLSPRTDRSGRWWQWARPDAARAQWRLSQATSDLPRRI